MAKNGSIATTFFAQATQHQHQPGCEVKVGVLVDEVECPPGNLPLYVQCKAWRGMPAVQGTVLECRGNRDSSFGVRLAASPAALPREELLVRVARSDQVTTTFFHPLQFHVLSVSVDVV